MVLVLQPSLDQCLAGAQCKRLPGLRAELNLLWCGRWAWATHMAKHCGSDPSVAHKEQLPNAEQARMLKSQQVDPWMGPTVIASCGRLTGLLRMPAVQALGGMQREPGKKQDPRLKRMLGKRGVYNQDVLISLYQPASMPPAGLMCCHAQSVPSVPCEMLSQPTSI